VTKALDEAWGASYETRDSTPFVPTNDDAGFSSGFGVQAGDKMARAVLLLFAPRLNTGLSRGYNATQVSSAWRAEILRSRGENRYYSCKGKACRATLTTALLRRRDASAV